MEEWRSALRTVQPLYSLDLLERLSLAFQVQATLRKLGETPPSPLHCSSTTNKQPTLPGSVPTGNRASRRRSNTAVDGTHSSGAGGQGAGGQTGLCEFTEPPVGLRHDTFVFAVAMALQAEVQTIQRTQLLRSLEPHIFPLRAARKSLPEHASVTPSQDAVQSDGILVTSTRQVPRGAGRVSASPFNRSISHSVISYLGPGSGPGSTYLIPRPVPHLPSTLSLPQNQIETM